MIEAKDAEIGALKAVVETQQRSFTADLTARDERLAGLEAELAKLRAQLGRDSTNSSTPPSKDPIAAKAKRKNARSQRVRSKDRKPGGQPGHPGCRLEPTDSPDRTERADPPADCAGCGKPLDGAADTGDGWAQIWDIPPVAIEKVHWQLPRRRCGCCGKPTTAGVPFGQPGTVSYGPNLNAAAVLLSSQGNVPVERTAALMEALLGVPVSAGFVARAVARIGERLADAGFDAALRAALRAEDVLCADESPVNLLRKDTDEHGQPAPGARTWSPCAPRTSGWSGWP